MEDEGLRDDGLKAFAEYLQNTHVGQRPYNGVEYDATFPYKTWNMYQRVKDDLTRTNNAIEGNYILEITKF